jgi:uridine kinase
LNEPVSALAKRIRELAKGRTEPLIVALDGRSAVGKSTLAARVAPMVDALVIDGDDFYSGRSSAEWDAMTPPEKVDACIDWRRQRGVLEALSRSETASWHPYDWASDDGRLARHSITADPAPVVVLDGAYSARPELADLLDLRVLYEAPAELRKARLIQREGADYREEWNARWDQAEDWYFTQIMTPERFDLILSD